MKMSIPDNEIGAPTAIGNTSPGFEVVIRAAPEIRQTSDTMNKLVRKCRIISPHNTFERTSTIFFISFCGTAQIPILIPFDKGTT